MDLRYGINPHQPARTVDGSDAAPLRVVSGDPSYINLLDALTAWQLVREAATATGEVVATSFKHVSPAGAATAGAVDAAAGEICNVDATASAATSAYVRARDADPKSSFGDMIAVSHPVDAELAVSPGRVLSSPGISLAGEDTRQGSALSSGDTDRAPSGTAGARTRWICASPSSTSSSWNPAVPGTGPDGSLNLSLCIRVSVSTPE